jgi:hypothetical protein
MQDLRHTIWQARALVAMAACLAALALVATTAAARPVDPPGLYQRTHHAVPHQTQPSAAAPVSTAQDLPTVIVHEHPSALPLVLSGAALLIALTGVGFAVTRVSSARRDPANLVR